MGTHWRLREPARQLRRQTNAFRGAEMRWRGGGGGGEGDRPDLLGSHLPISCKRTDVSVLHEDRGYDLEDLQEQTSAASFCRSSSIAPATPAGEPQSCMRAAA